MRAMDIEMRTWYGSPAYFVLGAVHAAHQCGYVHRDLKASNIMVCQKNKAASVKNQSLENWIIHQKDGQGYAVFLPLRRGMV